MEQIPKTINCDQYTLRDAEREEVLRLRAGGRFGSHRRYSRPCTFSYPPTCFEREQALNIEKQKRGEERE